MAKTRAQRKAERRAREAREARDPNSVRSDESRAQARTQAPESGDVAEVEAVLETGAQPEELGETVRTKPRPEPEPEPQPEPEPEPEAPAPSRAEVGAPPKEDRRERRRREKEARRRAKDSERRRQPTEREERRRGAVIGFLVSCAAELKRVQWPDRETLVQASAVTLLFIAGAAAYLGALDAAFNWLVHQIL